MMAEETGSQDIDNSYGQEANENIEATDDADGYPSLVYGTQNFSQSLAAMGNDSSDSDEGENLLQQPSDDLIPHSNSQDKAAPLDTGTSVDDASSKMSTSATSGSPVDGTGDSCGGGGGIGATSSSTKDSGEMPATVPQATKGQVPVPPQAPATPPQNQAPVLPQALIPAGPPQAPIPAGPPQNQAPVPPQAPIPAGPPQNQAPVPPQAPIPAGPPQNQAPVPPQAPIPAGPPQNLVPVPPPAPVPNIFTRHPGIIYWVCRLLQYVYV